MIEGYKCEFTTRLISAKFINSTLFGTSCKQRDYACLLKNSIVIWNQDIIHKCPFNKIAKINLNKTGNIIINFNHKLLFQIIENKEIHCEVLLDNIGMEVENFVLTLYLQFVEQMKI